MRTQRKTLRAIFLTGAVFLTAIVVAIGIEAGYLISRHRSEIDWFARVRDLRAPKVAVLPFSSVGLSSSEEYLPEGIVAEVISELSRNPGIRVLALGSVLRLNEERLTPSRMRKLYQISVLVKGSVRRWRDRLRVSLDVIDPRTQKALVSREFEGSMDQLFEIQSLIGHELSARLGSRPPLLVGGRGRSLASVTQAAPNYRAYLDYLKGRHAIRLATRESLGRALKLFKKAGAEDPSFAPAYAAGAKTLRLLAAHGHLSPPVAARLSDPMIHQALALDPGNVEALIELAQEQASTGRNPADAEASFRRAIAIEPGSASAHRRLGELLSSQGRMKEAREQLRLARELDPLSPEAQPGLQPTSRMR